MELDISGREVLSIQGDEADAFSEGYLCPKGVALKELDSDPDRLREPMIRRDGVWHSASWEEAFAEIDRRLNPIITQHGRDAVGLYFGNPVVHNTALTLYAPALRSALGTHNVFTASSVDQAPKQLAVALMFGNGLSMPIPDIDRCQYLLILGANPLVSNGSLLTAPNIGERLKRLRQRGGKMVVIDPCRTKTATAADEHFFIRPGTDAFFLFAIIHTLFAENLTSLGKLDQHTDGIEKVKSLAESFSPETVAAQCGIDADAIRTIARDIASAESAAVYGRIGTCTQRFGTLASWLPEVIHVLTGNLDREGGAMFTKAAHGPPNTKGAAGAGRGLRTGRWKSRVREFPEIFGELPVACLAEEIETPGEGQIRALVTVAGNPVLSTPNSERLSRAFESLDFMVSLDLFLNETTRHADVILPGISPLENSHYDFVFSQLAVRNNARFSPKLFEPPRGQLTDWETILRLVALLTGKGLQVDTASLDREILLQLIHRETKTKTSTIHGRDPQEILKALEPRVGPERMIDFMLRTGPYGEGFGGNSEVLSLAVLEANPHGVDLGALQQRIPEVLRTRSGKIELAPEMVIEDVVRLQQSLSEENEEMVLIGRRHLRSNNSWMHNIERLVVGKRRCTLQLNPTDAERLGLQDAEMAAVSSRVGAIEIPVEITDAILPGVASIPHGWGHDGLHTKLQLASAHAGVNSNVLADEEIIDIPSGNAVLCGIPIQVKQANGTIPSSSEKI